jgi:hydrophobic/amphiphilic exporter-1 (mainly G- bacteria), HAE1 family
VGEFFIRRPTVAIVISILFVLIGGVAMLESPIEQYPSVSPPMIRVETTYPGAGAEVVEESVATPIEQQVNGVDNSIYMKSLNTSDGRLQLDVSFQVDMDLDTANVLTQNRVSQAQSRLPQDVTKQGVTVKKLNPSMLLAVSIFSPNSTYDALYLNNYAMINVRDALLRVKGVASVDLIGGAEYGMRVWLNPERLGELGLQPADVIKAIREQNIQAPAGQVGGSPAPAGQQTTYTVKAPRGLTTPEQFEEIQVLTTAEGAVVRVKDVGRVELGNEFYKSFGRLSIPRPPPETKLERLSGGPAAILAVYLLPGANQIESAKGIYKTLEDQSAFFPEDVRYLVTYDTTPAVTESIQEVEHTFIEALILVILVVIVFLQKVRATIIPLLTIPVSIIGTFAFFPLIGFSVNTLSLFGLVLAIGIVVDDAIVVVEAVMHNIEHGMKPREATIQAMKEVSAPVIGIALVLCAVFIPVAGLGGLTGRLYQQFALTIAISVLISAFSALSLSPALCALFLKPHDHKSTGVLATLTAPIGKFFGLFFAAFNKVFDVSTKGYVKVCGLLVRTSILSLVVVGVAGAGAVMLMGQTAKAFVPDEDQGLFLVNVQLPPASSLERTDEACRKIEQVLWETPGIESFNTVGGLAFINNTFGPDRASFLVRLRPWDLRDAPDLTAFAILEDLKKRLAAVPEAVAFPFLPPTLPGFGAAGGFTAYLQDRSGSLGVRELGEHGATFLRALAQRPEVASPFTAFNPRVPQIAVDIDREKARTLGVPVDAVFAALQAAFGGTYVNDFNRFGRLYRVYVQADGAYRSQPEDIGKIQVRSSTTNEMVPLATVLNIQPSVPGTELTCRFNLMRSIEVSGSAAQGYSSGQAMDAVEQVAKATLPREMQVAWGGLSFQEKTAPSPVPTFILAVVFVFLLLAAMYESWGLPFAVLLGTPFVALGAYWGVVMGGFTDNVFVQVGLVMLIGLAAKNSILIVEFAKMKRDAGMPAREAALEAARLRFRPILMTAFAFILGVVPLMTASGSGAASRSVMGTAVFWGMLVATALGVFATPALYALVEFFRKDPPKPPAPPPGGSGGHAPHGTAGGHH